MIKMTPYAGEMKHWRRERMGGISNAFRNFFIWVSILSVVVLWSLSTIIRIKKNYTDLHHRVNQIEYKLGR